MNAKEALQLLQDGNTRFAAGVPIRVTQTTVEERSLLAEGQSPFAIILGCSDSRAPVELIFDQNLGDLFVIRVAGNIVDPALLGSVEFAAQQFGTRLVVVLGHSNCGAVKATIGELQQPSQAGSPNVGYIVNSIKPAVEALLATNADDNADLFLRKAVRSNISASANQLRQNSAILTDLIENDGLKVIGAEYSLKTGLVEFFDHI
jgi:carbonic anhydrase